MPCVSRRWDGFAVQRLAVLVIPRSGTPASCSNISAFRRRQHVAAVLGQEHRAYLDDLDPNRRRQQPCRVATPSAQIILPVREVLLLPGGH